MTIDISLQTSRDMTLPTMPVKVYSGSSLPLEIVGIPAKISGGDVAGVSVTVTNANGVAVTGTAVRDGSALKVLFAASNFANYGFVAKGFRVSATVRRAGMPDASVTLAVGDFEILAASASSQPGTPGTFYVVKGDRCFVRSRVVGGVQHYVEQTMEYDAQIGWGANWSGDYILSSSGEFIEFTEA